MFKPMLEKPKNNPYYITKESGGWNTCGKGNPVDKEADALANCIAFAVGRFNEVAEAGWCHWFGSMDAKSFYIVARDTYHFPVGTEPKIGAIACWSGGSNGQGHVASVEVNNKNGTWKLAMSGHNAYVFKVVNASKKNNWGMPKSYKFQGFVYNPYIQFAEITKPVERNVEVNQLEVIKNKLRIRTEPNLKGEILGFAELGYYNDLETCEADGYTWHKVDENNWLAQVDGYVQIFPKEEPKQIELGDTVIVNGVGTASSTGDGAKTRKYVNQEMKVIMISGNVSRPNRYGLNQYNKGKINDGSAVTGWFSENDIKKK